MQTNCQMLGQLSRSLGMLPLGLIFLPRNESLLEAALNKKKKEKKNSLTFMNRFFLLEETK